MSSTTPDASSQDTTSLQATLDKWAELTFQEISQIALGAIGSCCTDSLKSEVTCDSACPFSVLQSKLKTALQEPFDRTTATELVKETKTALGWLLNNTATRVADARRSKACSLTGMRNMVLKHSRPDDGVTRALNRKLLGDYASDAFELLTGPLDGIGERLRADVVRRCDDLYSLQGSTRGGMGRSTGTAPSTQPGLGRDLLVQHEYLDDKGLNEHRKIDEYILAAATACGVDDLA